MSISVLRDIFSGRVGEGNCVRAILFLKSPKNAKEYLRCIHNVVFPDGDLSKEKKWQGYSEITHISSVIPIKGKDLADRKFMNEIAEKLSFDISRFIDFLSGYAEVSESIKPIMLHYAAIYLLDFFARTWLKYNANAGHGLKMHTSNESSINKFEIEIKKMGIFPRAVDSFYFLGQSSLFSHDNSAGIGYIVKGIEKGIISKRIRKMRYDENPTISFTHIIDVYDRLKTIVGKTSNSNSVLTGYIMLFLLSSVCRYKAKGWAQISENRDLKSKFDLLQHDFVYEHVPTVFLETILRRGLKKELSIPGQ
jgi:hypothetical protein